VPRAASASRRPDPPEHTPSPVVAKPLGHPRDRRLRRRSEFSRTYEQGRKIVSRAFVLFARQNEAGITRLGVTATRKIGNAVVRNRARRLVREAFRQCRRDLPPGYDLVVVVRPPLLRMNPAQIIPALLEAAGRLEASA